jgi:surfeit locus 1 family protein
MQTKGLIGFTALALAMLAVLIGLGVWQVKRLHWKEGLIAAIDARTKAEPISLDQAIALAKEGQDPTYYRVRVEGRFDNSKELYLFSQSISDGTPGWHVITPFTTSQGELVLVDRGFVPDNLTDPSMRASGQIEGVTTVTGIVRAPDAQGLFTPNNEPEANRWFWRDLNGMVASMFSTATLDVPPFFLEAEKSEVPGGWPQGGQTRLELPNNHLQYAITWFGLAAALVVIYAFYVRSLYRREHAEV